MSGAKIMQMPARPNYATFLEGDPDRGFVRTTSGAAWLYGVVPLGLVRDATTPELSKLPGETLNDAIEAIQSELTGRILRRQRKYASSEYRDINVMLVNLPQRWQPRCQISDYLATAYPGRMIPRRLLLLGVQVHPSSTSGTWRDTLSSYASTFINKKLPDSNYSRDRGRIEKVFSKAGLLTPTDEEMAFARRWWNTRRAETLAYIPHSDHLHTFTDRVEGNRAHQMDLDASGDKTSTIDGAPCLYWPDSANRLDLGFATLAGISLGMPDETSLKARWVSSLVDNHAACISLRAKVEPADITGNEVDRIRRVYQNDIASRAKSGKEDDLAQIDTFDDLKWITDTYKGQGFKPATLSDLRMLVAFEGRHPTFGWDPEPVGREAGLDLLPMDEQHFALMESMMGSSHRVNPYHVDIPAHTLAQSGIAELSRVGDPETCAQPAVLGFTVRGRQPVFVNGVAKQTVDGAPLLVMFGSSRSGKTAAAMVLCDEWVQTVTPRGENTPVFFFTPKVGEDFSQVVARTSGRTTRLDDAMTDGAFDPIRVIPDRQEAKMMAINLLQQVDPWEGAVPMIGTLLEGAMDYGIRHGATGTLEALELAAAHDPERFERVADPCRMMRSNPLFRALFGLEHIDIDDAERGMSMRAGFNYLMVGTVALTLPSADQPSSAWTMPQRLSVALIVSVVTTAVAAMRGRSGVVVFDEAWMLLLVGSAIFDQVMRVAALWKVLLVLLTQKVTDGASLKQHTSRAIIMAQRDTKEAIAACELVGLEPTPERIATLTAHGETGDPASPSGTVPNRNSMHHLHVTDPETGEKRNIRGTIAWHADLSGRVVPVEVVLPRGFIECLPTSAPEEQIHDPVAASRLPAAA